MDAIDVVIYILISIGFVYAFVSILEGNVFSEQGWIGLVIVLSGSLIIMYRMCRVLKVSLLEEQLKLVKIRELVTPEIRELLPSELRALLTMNTWS